MSYIPAEREQPSAANAPGIFNAAYAAIKGGEAPRERKNGPGGQRKPLKRLDSDKTMAIITLTKPDNECQCMTGQAGAQTMTSAMRDAGVHVVRERVEELGLYSARNLVEDIWAAMLAVSSPQSRA